MCCCRLQVITEKHWNKIHLNSLSNYQEQKWFWHPENKSFVLVEYPWARKQVNPSLLKLTSLNSIQFFFNLCNSFFYLISHKTHLPHQCRISDIHNTCKLIASTRFLVLLHKPVSSLASGGLHCISKALWSWKQS